MLMPEPSFGYETVTPDEELFYKALGARISELRRELDLTQQALANELGISQQILAHYEVGRFRLPVYILPDLAASLGITVSELLDRLKKVSTKRRSRPRSSEHG
jgi:transcriptional regulator with XRE-family HTH domain